MAAHVRGTFRVLRRLSPSAAAGIPLSRPAAGVPGRTTSARTMVVGTRRPWCVFLHDGAPSVGASDAFPLRCLVSVDCGVIVFVKMSVSLFMNTFLARFPGLLVFDSKKLINF